jgi:stringent starvation protein B
LNLSGHAIRNVAVEADGLGFNSRFQGQPHSIWVPIGAILGLVSRETSDGLWFPENQPSVAGPSQLALGDVSDEASAETDQLKDTPKDTGEAEKPRGRPNLTIVD